MSLYIWFTTLCFICLSVYCCLSGQKRARYGSPAADAAAAEGKRGDTAPAADAAAAESKRGDTADTDAAASGDTADTGTFDE